MTLVFHEKHTCESEFLNIIDASNSADKTLICERKQEM